MYIIDIKNNKTIKTRITMFEESVKQAAKLTRQRRSEALKALKKIQARLENYRIDKSCTNWGDAGSIGYVLDRLSELEKDTGWMERKA